MAKLLGPWSVAFIAVVALVVGAGAALAQPAAGSAREACTAAMNADPAFAAAIVKTANEQAAAQRDADTVKAHTDAYEHVQKNERHVIIAYGAMWLIAAGFVLYLWRRQQALKLEIAQLARELEAAEPSRSAGKS